MGDPSLNIIQGRLEAFSETGTEGTIWCFYEDGKDGYDGLHPLQKGDVLMIFNDAARREVVWEGVVDFDTDAHRRKHPLIKTGEVQWVDNIGVVHGVQRDFDAEAWAALFLAEKPALLIPRPRNF